MALPPLTQQYTDLKQSYRRLSAEMRQLRIQAGLAATDIEAGRTEQALAHLRAMATKPVI